MSRVDDESLPTSAVSAVLGATQPLPPLDPRQRPGYLAFRTPSDVGLPDVNGTKKVIDTLFERHEVYAIDPLRLEQVTDRANAYRVVETLNLTAEHVRRERGAGATGGGPRSIMAERDLTFADLTEAGRVLLFAFLARAGYYLGHAEEKLAAAAGATLRAADREDGIMRLADGASSSSSSAEDDEERAPRDVNGRQRAPTHAEPTRQMYDTHVTCEPLLGPAPDCLVLGYRFTLFSRFPLQRYLVEAIEVVAWPKREAALTKRAKTWKQLKERLKRLRHQARDKHVKAVEKEAARLQHRSDAERKRAQRQQKQRPRQARTRPDGGEAEAEAEAEEEQVEADGRAGPSKRGRSSGSRTVSAAKRQRRDPSPLPPPLPLDTGTGGADVSSLLESDEFSQFEAADLRARRRPPPPPQVPSAHPLREEEEEAEEEEEEEEEEVAMGAQAREEGEDEEDEDEGDEGGEVDDAMYLEAARRVTFATFLPRDARHIQAELARSGPQALDRAFRRPDRFRRNAQAILEAERAYVQRRFKALKKNDKVAIFGRDGAEHYRAEYAYLAPRGNATQQSNEQYLAYYGREQVEAVALDDDDARKLASLHAGGVVTADVLDRLAATTFTVADAFVFGGVLSEVGGGLDPAYYTPASYYPPGDADLAADAERIVAATRQSSAAARQVASAARYADAMDLEDEPPASPPPPPAGPVATPLPLAEFWRRLRSTLPGLFRSGAAAPTSFPRREAVVFLQPAYCHPEVMHNLALPFTWQKSIRPQLATYARPIDAFATVPEHVRLLAHYLVLRHAASNYDTPEDMQRAHLVAADALGHAYQPLPAEQLEREREPRPGETPEEAIERAERSERERQATFVRELPLRDRDAGDVVTSLLSLATGPLNQRRLAEREELEADTQRLIGFAREVEGNAHRRLHRRAIQFKGDLYPGLLSPLQTRANDAAIRLAEQEREQYFLVPPAELQAYHGRDGGGGGGGGDGDGSGGDLMLLDGAGGDGGGGGGGEADGMAAFGQPEAAIRERGLRAYVNNAALDVTNLHLGLDGDDNAQQQEGGGGGLGRPGGHHYATRYLERDPDEEANNPDAPPTPAQLHDQERTRRALEVRSHAGAVGSMSESLIRQSAHVAMKIINTARYEQLARELQDEDMSTTVKLQRQQQAVMEALVESFRCAMETENESQTYSVVRHSAFQLMNSVPTSLRLPVQPLINDDLSFSYRTWLEDSVMPIYSVSNKAQPALRLLIASGDSHMNLSDAGDNAVLPNIILTGANQVGKSFGLSKAAAMMLPGTCMSFSHITTHALASGRNQSFGIFVFHEAPPGFFIDPNDRSNSKKVDSSSGGDPQKVQILKNMLTEGVLTTMALTIDEKNKKVRRSELYQSLAQNLWWFAINWDKEKISPPVMSRLMPFEFRVSSHETSGPVRSAVNSQRLAQDIHTVTTMHQRLHALCFFIHSLVAMGVLPEGVMIENARHFRDDIVTRLQQDFNFSDTLFTTRLFQQTDHLAVNDAIRQTAWELLATDYGHTWIDRLGRGDPTSLECFLGFIFPRLYVQMSHMAYVTSLVAFRFDSVEMEDIFLILASDVFLHTNEPRQQRPLTRKDGAGVVGTEMLVQRYIIGPQTRRHAASVRQADLDGDLGGGGGGGGAAVDPVLDDPARGRVPATDGQGSLLIEDHRYLTYHYAKWDTFVNAIGKQLETKCGYRLRKEAVESMLGQYERQYILSPFYDRHAGTGELFIVKEAGTGAVPTDSIPVIKRYHEESTVAVAVQFFTSRYSLPMVADDAEKLMHVVREQQIDADSVLLFEQEMHQSADQRLVAPCINSLNAKERSFIARLAEVNILRHTTGLAMLGAASAANLGRTSLPGMPRYDNAWEQARAKKPLITAWAPRNFYLNVHSDERLSAEDQALIAHRDPVAAAVAAAAAASRAAHGDGSSAGGRGTTSLVYMHMGAFLQRLTAVRNRDASSVPTFPNNRSLGVTGRSHIKATLAGLDRRASDVTAENSAILAEIAHQGRKYELDYDYLSAVERLLSLGAPGKAHPDKMGELLVRKLGVPMHEPCTYPPNAVLLFRAFERHVDVTQDRQSLADMCYPEDDIKELIDNQITSVVRQRKGLHHTFTTAVAQAFGRTYYELVATTTDSGGGGGGGHVTPTVSEDAAAAAAPRPDEAAMLVNGHADGEEAGDDDGMALV